MRPRMRRSPRLPRRIESCVGVAEHADVQHVIATVQGYTSLPMKRVIGALGTPSRLYRLTRRRIR